MAEIYHKLLPPRGLKETPVPGARGERKEQRVPEETRGRRESVGTLETREPTVSKVIQAK